MSKRIIKSEKDTERLAKKLVGQFCSGGVIGLIGDLGAGKTTFTQYFAKALGVTKTVNSPTFNIIKEYKVRYQVSGVRCLIHIDAYRLNSAEELTELGVQEYFNDPQAITIIEWADKVKKLLPKNAAIIKMKLNKDGTRVFNIKNYL